MYKFKKKKSKIKMTIIKTNSQNFKIKNKNILSKHFKKD